MLKFDFEIVLRNRFTGTLSFLVLRGVEAINLRLASQYALAYGQCEAKPFQTIVHTNNIT